MFDVGRKESLLLLAPYIASYLSFPHLAIVPKLLCAL